MDIVTNKYWYGYARIISSINPDKSISYFTDVNDEGHIDSYKDTDNYYMEDEFDTLDDAKNDLLNQGYFYNNEIGLYMIVLGQDDKDHINMLAVYRGQEAS